MIRVRDSEDRGRTDLGWLDSRHTFSFGNYHDPERMGFRSVRVINDDRVRPGAGFGEHPHQDMEIVSYVLSGALSHRDSMGNSSVLSAGDVQRMTAGTGVRHSEMNPSLEESTRFLQIWILPQQKGLQPGYEELHVSEDEKRGRLTRVASGSGLDGALRIHQDVELLASIVEVGESVMYSLVPGRHAWIQVARGSVSINGHDLEEGDGAAVSGEPELRIEGLESAEVLLFDLD